MDEMKPKVRYPVLNPAKVPPLDSSLPELGPWPVPGTDYVTWTPPWFSNALEFHEEDCPCEVCVQRRAESEREP